MSQADSPNTTSPSRRALLAGAPAVAVAALAAGTAANGLATAMAAPSAPDPIFAVIAEHRAAIEALNQAVEANIYDTQAECDCIEDLFYEVLTTQPTSLAGAVALLVHLGQPEFIGEYEDYVDFDSRSTLLSSIESSADDEIKQLGRNFPLRIAETLRGLIAEARS